MKISKFPALTSTLVLLAMTITALLVNNRNAVAQRSAQPSNQNKIAVIDVKYILENHARFTQAMDGLKGQFEVAGAQLDAAKKRIVSMQKKLLTLNSGSPDYNTLDEQIAREKSEWSIKANKHRKEIQRKEAQILWNVYYEVKTETKRYCEQNGIGLVISFNGEKIDSDNPQAVVRAISRPIIYNAPHLDITPWVLASLNREGRAPIASATPVADNRNGAPRQQLPRK